MNSSRPVLEIDLFSDVVCPWCYIGETRFRKALESMGDQAPEIRFRWHPFQLQPDMPEQGIDWREFAEEKFGGMKRAEQLFEHVTDVACEDGLCLDFKKMTRTANTKNAHRLILWAQERGKGRELSHALYKAYFENGLELGNEDAVAQLAAEATGLPETEVRVVLAARDDAYAEAVDASQIQAARLGIRGVPFFIFNQRLGVSGAQTPDIFVDAIRQALDPSERGSPSA